MDTDPKATSRAKCAIELAKMIGLERKTTSKTLILPRKKSLGTIAQPLLFLIPDGENQPMSFNTYNDIIEYFFPSTMRGDDNGN